MESGKFDPFKVDDGSRSEVLDSETTEGQNRRDQLIAEIDYDRVKEEIEKIYIPESVEKNMLDDYKYVVVRDFGDIYHLSEKEREEENKFYHLFRELLNMSQKENKIEAFIKRSRLTLKALYEIAEANGIFSPEKFVKDYFKGKIEISGLPVPKLKKKVRNKYNMKYLTDFIMGDEDPSLFERNLDDYDEDEPDLEDIIPPETIKAIDESVDDDESTYSYFDDEDDQDGRNVALVLHPKAVKDIAKHIPGLCDASVEFRKRDKRIRETSRALNGYIGDIREDDFAMIRNYDQRIYANIDNIPEPEPPDNFEDDDAVNAYLLAMDRYLERTTYTDGDGNRVVTIEEKDEMDIKEELERNGFDPRAMYGFKEQRKKLEKIRKREKRKEKALKEKLYRVQKRRDKRMDAIDGRNRAGEHKRTLTNDKKKKKKDKKKKKKAKQASKDFINETTGFDLSKENESNAFNFTWDM